jgi:hypothetical protein
VTFIQTYKMAKIASLTFMLAHNINLVCVVSEQLVLPLFELHSHEIPS